MNHPSFNDLQIPSEDSWIPKVAVVTLWRSGWDETQQAVLAYLLKETFPPDTKLIWLAESGSATESHLEAAWPELEERGASPELVVVPVAARKSLGKHPLGSRRTGSRSGGSCRMRRASWSMAGRSARRA